MLISNSSYRASSTRLLAGVWWFFTLIMVSSYTANLVAFLTLPAVQLPFKSVEELAKQTHIKYGCYCCGHTSTFFRVSREKIAFIF